MSLAPGSYVTVSAAASSPNGNAPTGTWFVTGQTAQGPSGAAVPITSLNDFTTYLGARTTTSSLLYDSLDEFFADGGVLAYVSRAVLSTTVAAHVSLMDGAMSPVATLAVTAAGPGTWGNSLSVVVAAAASPAVDGYTLQILNNGTPIITSPNLFSPADAVIWFNSVPVWLSQVVVTNLASGTSPPDNNPAPGTFALASGTDGTPLEADWTTALNVFAVGDLGPGQVSAPGHTTSTGYTNLAEHAQANNRTALLDVADNVSAASLITQAQGVQSTATDPGYGAMFAPWLIIPGLAVTNAGTTSPVPLRTVPPSSLAAAKMASNDKVQDANNPAAGVNGASGYAIGVTQSYVDSDLGDLNAAGVDVIRMIQNVPTIYGYRSLATDPTWVDFSNVRFRMQVINDFDQIANGFVFAEIDGQGHVFVRLNGALAGKCQQYWLDGSLYGNVASDAFLVNTGPQVNTPATIQAGQINAQVLLRMSPFGEFVNINVVKYSVTTSLPASA